MRIHFIGICGSGQAAIAIIAKNLGYIVIIVYRIIIFLLNVNTVKNIYRE